MKVTQPPVPQILTFSTDKTSVESGASLQLNWTTKDAYYCTLNQNPVATNGSRLDYPKIATTYKLICQNRM